MRVPFSFVRDRVQTPRGFLGAVAGPSSVAVGAVMVAMVINARTLGTYEAVLVSALVFGCLAISLQVIMGNTGLIFFGQFAFVAVGAYTSGVLTVPVASRELLLPDLPAWLADVEMGFGPSVIVASLAAGVVALAASPVLARVSGLAAAVVSLGLVYIVSDLLRETRDVTRGSQTFSGVPYDTTLATSGLALVAIAVIASVFKYSRWGLEARAGREDHVAAEASGLSLGRVRIPAILLGAMLSGAAGAVWAHYLTAFSPATFALDPAVIVVIMAVIGGVNSISGAVVGAVLVATWQELSRHVEGGLTLFGTQLPRMPEFGSLTLGIGLIAILALRPNGLLGSLELQWFRPRTPARAPDVVADLPRTEEVSV